MEIKMQLPNCDRLTCTLTFKVHNMRVTSLRWTLIGRKAPFTPWDGGWKLVVVYL